MAVRAYLGIDPSLRKTGLSLIIDNDGLLETRVTCSTPKHLTGTPRLQYHRTQLQELVRGLTPIFTAIEGPSLYSVNRADDLGDLRGRLSLTMEDLESPVLRIPPTVLKKFATGNGGASKTRVQIAAIDMWGQPMTEDEADASWLAFIAYAYFSPEPLPGLTRAQLEVIKRLQQPKKRQEHVPHFKILNV
jgi:Holliday junction resolvasome RuvABC endonuclease subunit